MKNLLLYVRESSLEQISRVRAQKRRVGDGWVWDGGGIVQRHSDLICLNQLEQTCKEDSLQLETAFVVGVREHKEDILHDA